MALPRLFWFLSLIIGGTWSLDEEVALMVQDVLRSDHRQASASPVVAFICWDAHEAVDLVRRLSKSGLMVSVHTHPETWPPLSSSQDPFTSYLLDGSCDETGRLLAQASQLKLFSAPRLWLLLEDIKCTSGAGGFHEIITNQERLSVETSEMESYLEQPVDGSLESVTSDNVSEYIPEPNTSHRDTHDPVIGRCGEKSLQTILSTLDIYVDSQVVIAIETQAKMFILTEVFKRGPKQPLVFSLFGSWSKLTGLQLMVSPVLSMRRIDLQGEHINSTMVVTNNDTFNHLWDGMNIHIDPISKLNLVLTSHVFNMMNASLGLTTEGSWGYATNGSWNGMVGYLQRNESEIGATALFFTADRLVVLEYIAMTTPTRAKFIFRKPPLSFVSNVFILPFSTGVWLSSSCLVVICGGLLYAALRWERRRNKGGSEDQDLDEYIRALGVDKEVSWSDVVLLSLGAVCQQGSTTESRGTPGRIISILMFIAVMFLYTSYSAYIVALLQSTTESISSLEDLLISRLELGADDTVYNRYYFSTATEPVRKAIYRKKVAPPGVKPRFYTLDEGVDRIRRGFFAFHVEESLAYKVMTESYTEGEKCGLGTIGGYIQVVNPWVAVRKNTPYKEMFKVSFRRLLDCGIQNREVSRFYTKKPECSGHGSSFMSVGIVDFYPALLVLAYGILSSIGVLFIELFTRKRGKLRNRNMGSASVSPLVRQQNDESSEYIERL